MKISININTETHLFHLIDGSSDYLNMLRKALLQNWPDADISLAATDRIDLIAVAGFGDNEAVKSSIYLLKSALWEKGNWALS